MLANYLRAAKPAPSPRHPGKPLQLQRRVGNCCFSTRLAFKEHAPLHPPLPTAAQGQGDPWGHRAAIPTPSSAAPWCWTGGELRQELLRGGCTPTPYGRAGCSLGFAFWTRFVLCVTLPPGWGLPGSLGWGVDAWVLHGHSPMATPCLAPSSLPVGHRPPRGATSPVLPTDPPVTRGDRWPRVPPTVLSTPRPSWGRAKSFFCRGFLASLHENWRCPRCSESAAGCWKGGGAR